MSLPTASCARPPRPTARQPVQAPTRPLARPTIHPLCALPPDRHAPARPLTRPPNR